MKGLYLYNISSLRPFWTLSYIKLNFITFLQALKAFPGDCGVVDKNILARLLLYEAVAFGVIEPLYFTFCHTDTSFQKLKTCPVFRAATVPRLILRGQV